MKKYFQSERLTMVTRCREEMFITSKLSHDGMASYEAALQEFGATLAELQTTYVDLFLIHRAGDSQAQRRENRLFTEP